MLKQMTAPRWLGVIVLLAVAGRLAFIALFSDTLSLQTSGYDTYAVNVMEGRGYTRFDDRDGDSDLPPLYPFFLVGVYEVFGRDPVAVALVQIGLDVLTVLLIYWVGRRVAGERVGLLAAALYGLYPYLLYQNLTLNDTGLFILLLAAGSLAYQARDRRDWRGAALLGALFGLAALTKAFILLMLPLLALWWWRQIGLRAAIRLALAAGVAAALVLAPWMIRNIRLHDAFVLISTNGGSNLHQGNNPCVADYLARGWDAQWVNCIELAPDTLTEVESDRWHRQQALDYLRENPGDWPRLFWTKLWVLWSPAIMPYDLPPDPYLIDDVLRTTTAFEVACGAPGHLWAAAAAGRGRPVERVAARPVDRPAGDRLRDHHSHVSDFPSLDPLPISGRPVRVHSVGLCGHESVGPDQDTPRRAPDRSERGAL